MKKVIYLLAYVAFLGCYSCSDDDDGLKMQDISVEFAVSDAGMDGTGIDLGIKLSRATKESLDVTVQMISTEVSESDITVTPALTNGQVVVNIPAGQASGSFTVAKADGKSPEGNVKFRILSLSLSEGYKIGTLQEMNLSFSPIVSTGGKFIREMAILAFSKRLGLISCAIIELETSRAIINSTPFFFTCCSFEPN